MKRRHLIIGLVAVVALARTALGQTVDESRAPDESQLRAWAAQLEADDYFAREQASESLLTAGLPAVAVLADAARGQRLESTARAMSILGRIALDEDNAASAAAEEALDQLSRNPDPGMAYRAKAALRSRREHRREDALAKLQALGANTQMQNNQLHMVSISGSRWDGTDEDLALLRWFPELGGLSLADLPLGDEALAVLSDVSHVQMLVLQRVQLTDTGFKHVAKLAELQFLLLAGVPLTDDAMATVGSLSRLQALQLNECRVTDAGFAYVGQLGNLVTLETENTALSDAGMIHLGKLAQLQNLELRHTQVSDEGLAHLAPLSRLRTLRVKYSPVGDEHLSRLAALPSLGELTLFGTDVSEKGEAAFKNLRQDVVVDRRAGGLLGIQGTAHPQGCQVAFVQSDSAAQKSGIHEEDIITHFDGTPVQDFDELRGLIGQKRAGDTVEVRLLRGDEKLVRRVSLGEWP